MNRHTRSSCANRLPALDLLRLLAALSVVLFHYTFRGWAADGYTHVHLPALISWTKYGARGVSLFFVISGFVIAYSAAGRAAQEFAMARIVRLYPTFVFCMTLTFAVTLLFGMPPFTGSLQQWLANLAIAAPALGQPYMDGAYWSIVAEITFYAWMALFIAAGLFPRYLAQLSFVWLAITLLNVTVIHSGAVERIFLTEVSGFFAAGLLLYEIFFRQSSSTGWMLLIAATLIAAFQTIEAASWSRAHYAVEFSSAVITALCVASVVLVALAIQVRRLPLNAPLVAALGGLTYPLYLLHQHVGYIIFNRSEGVVPDWLLVSVVIALMLTLSWAVWRFVEPKGQSLARRLLSDAAIGTLSWRASLPLFGQSAAQAMIGTEDSGHAALGADALEAVPPPGV